MPREEEAHPPQGRRLGSEHGHRLECNGEEESQSATEAANAGGSEGVSIIRWVDLIGDVWVMHERDVISGEAWAVLSRCCRVLRVLDARSLPIR